MSYLIDAGENLKGGVPFLRYGKSDNMGLCDLCSTTNNVFIYIILKDKIPVEYKYLESLSVFDLCFDCLIKEDKKHVKNIEEHLLPLYINHEWVTWDGEEAFMNRLKGLEV